MTHNREINKQPGSLSYSQPDPPRSGLLQRQENRANTQPAGQSIDLVFAGKQLHTASNGQRRQCRNTGKPPKKHTPLRP
ncbi:hypothetical protein DPMN_032714 [Dreissena polymorpha]|uniref:Uncharacterized protein n=1 Tax=Dreissena polymorpha TaxID=45954 RepID=A0A9D4M4A3_DREPO|nr:hypothetical protein DPMN_032714 [Dreissena polymorpha]